MRHPKWVSKYANADTMIAAPPANAVFSSVIVSAFRRTNHWFTTVIRLGATPIPRPTAATPEYTRSNCQYSFTPATAANPTQHSSPPASTSIPAPVPVRQPARAQRRHIANRPCRPYHESELRRADPKLPFDWCSEHQEPGDQRSKPQES